jgi:uncharacterized protein (TIGR02246 family)
MSSQSFRAQESASTDEVEVRALYRKFLDAWNRRDANGMAELFSQNGQAIGFDGSQMNGRSEIAGEIGQVFANHQTAAYVAKIREVRFLTPDVAVLRAVVGMVPPGQSDLNPAVNAIQTLVSARKNSEWQIELSQNTPAQFHGRPELVEQLTEELRQLL